MDKLDIRVALSVFDKVMTNGERKEDAFFLDGLYATPSFDGYTVTLSDEKVTLSILFHNKFNMEYDSRKSLNEFMLKLDRIEQAY
ncbi:MAG: DUF3081 domain-containing protein [Oceanicoccus sp.]|uniref:DUF3081 family protein n=1 Tax=Oceanicoccus sp. TaxID=2691044 RepID=UPI0026381BEE|nr:DUF3081 family protein [Oceanicoccus sp.]MCP3908905.1 DUF3081 domain-containing protein [Oceanicoccus sp.]MDG1773893.1 DUF3081 family protein [Oceanicoccus sp.]